jgi:RND family efflux transporter MFP subunit
MECLIEPHEVIEVSTAVEGILESIAVDKGDMVKKGQVLATLESQVEKATVEVARARATMRAALESGQVRLRYGRSKYERAGELYKDKFVSSDDMEEAETEKALAELSLAEANENIHLAELELERAQALLSMRTIRSPITGIVVERFLSPGEFAQAQPILQLAQIDPLNVEVVASVDHYGSIKVGTEAEVMPEEPVGGIYSATVTLVDRVIDAASGTFGVRLELGNPDYALPARLRCRVRFPNPQVLPQGLEDPETQPNRGQG